MGCGTVEVINIKLQALFIELDFLTYDEFINIAVVPEINSNEVEEK